MAEPARPMSGETGVTLSPSQFSIFSQMIYRLTGIVLKDHKVAMIQARLNKRLLALGLTDFDTYLARLQDGSDPEETTAFINALTTNLTSFFRESHHFDDLAESVVRPLMGQGAQRFRIWSSACSTGEEPYSIAMTLHETGALRHPWDCKILATDLDSNVLRQASEGAYDASRFDNVDRSLLRATTEIQPDGRVAMRDTVRAPITFNQLNLLEPWPVKGPFDVIFCRNVLIYFDAETKTNIVNRFTQLLAPNGTLYLGHSESLLGDHPALTSLGRTIYRRRA